MKYYNYYPELFCAINKKLSGHCGNKLKIMFVIAGTSEETRNSLTLEQVMKESRLSKRQYNKALKELCDAGFLNIVKDKIAINFENLMK